MKKLFVLFAVATLFLGVQSCKPKPAADETQVEDLNVEVPAGDSGVATTDSTIIPAADTTVKAK